MINIRSTGYIGAEDEVMQHWLLRNRNRAESLYMRPDIFTADFFKNSAICSLKEYPHKKIKSAARDIDGGHFYRHPCPFSVILYPDGESVIRSGLSVSSIFPNLSAKSGHITVNDAMNIATDNYNEYLEHIPHAIDTDYLLEILFSPYITTVNQFADYICETIIKSNPSPDNTLQWFWNKACKRIIKAVAIAALSKWDSLKDAIILNKPVSEKAIERLSPVFFDLLRDLLYCFDDIITYETFKRRWNRYFTKESAATIMFYAKTFSVNDRYFLSAILHEYVDIYFNTLGTYRSPNTSLYMAGFSNTIAMLVGKASSNDSLLPWLVRTSTAFPNTVIYALSLDKWKEEQKTAFIRSLEDSCCNSLVIWTSRTEATVPDVFLEEYYITRESYTEGGFCFQSPECIPETGYLNGWEQDINDGDINKTTYEIGFLTQEIEDRIKKYNNNDMSGQAANLLGEEMAVLSPHMILPEDAIEDIRVRVLNTLGYDVNEVNHPSITADTVPDYYEWIADTAESHMSKVSLDPTDVRRRDAIRKKNKYSKYTKPQADADEDIDFEL